MSTQAVGQFLEQLANDSDLQAQLAVENKTRDERIAAAVELGGKRGYEFTAAECESFLEAAMRVQDGELADRELEAVAGGAIQPDLLKTTVIPLFGPIDPGTDSLAGTAVAGVRG